MNSFSLLACLVIPRGLATVQVNLLWQYSYCVSTVASKFDGLLVVAPQTNLLSLNRCSHYILLT